MSKRRSGEQQRGSVYGAPPSGERLERMLGSPRHSDGGFVNTSGVRPTLQRGSTLKTFGEFFLGGQKRSPPGPVPVALADLPPLDAVLVSHDHYDHLCFRTIEALAKTGVPFVTALGVGAHLEAWGVDPSRITELDWWQEARVGGGRLTLTATPAQHFSGRGPSDRNRTLWASWVLASERHRVFFSGDTGLTEEFVEIGKRMGPFDLVMLEIGAFHPSWGKIHLGPDNAMKAHAMLGGGPLLQVH